jgi:hypothetical protein
MMKCLTLGGVLAVVMASAGCMSYSSTTRTAAAPPPGNPYYNTPYYNTYAYSYSTSPGNSPNAAYTPQYSNETPASRYEYNSKGDYYRNYGGTYHPGPERNCPGC